MGEIMICKECEFRAPLERFRYEELSAGKKRRGGVYGAAAFKYKCPKCGSKFLRAEKP